MNSNIKSILLTPTPFFILLFLLKAATLQAAPKIKRYTAVFSDSQAYWQTKSSESTPSVPPLSIGILPINTSNTIEERPCDSCHRLTPNGLQFFLENYLLEQVSQQTSPIPVRLITPHSELVTGTKTPLLPLVDSLTFPLNQWFDGYEQTLIYRPRDRYTSTKTKKMLSKIGGTLGYSHLIIPTQFQMKVKPRFFSKFVGRLDYHFVIIFWNVKLSTPEWVIYYHEINPKTNLNHSLKKSLDKNLFTWIKNLPYKVKHLREQEPR